MFIGMQSFHPALLGNRQQTLRMGFIGFDGRWRIEIDDSTAQIVLPSGAEALRRLGDGCAISDVMLMHIGLPAPRANTRRLGEFLFHQELYKSYPSLSKIPVIFFQCGTSPVAEFHSLTASATPFTASNSCFLAVNVSRIAEMNELSVLAIVIHELQHAIQIVEGFAVGGSPHGEFKMLLHERGVREEDLDDEERQALHELACHRYGMLAGEVEAREVEARLLMESGFRRLNKPYAKLDPANLIIRLLEPDSGEELLAAAYPMEDGRH